MAQRNLVFAAGLIASFGLPAVLAAQNNGNLPTGNASITGTGINCPGLGSSVDAVPVTAATLTTPISTAIATCPLVYSGFPTGTATATATFNGGAGTAGSLSATSTFTSVIPGTATLTADAYANLINYVTVTAIDPDATAIATLEADDNLGGTLSTDSPLITASGNASIAIDNTENAGQGTLGYADVASAGAFDVQVDWTQVENNTFAYDLYVEATLSAYDPTSSFVDPDGSSSFFIDAPSITLLDAGGNDITSEYNLTYDTGLTTSTPEPASLTLFGTGLMGLAGVTWRRRRRPAA